MKHFILLTLAAGLSMASCSKNESNDLTQNKEEKQSMISARRGMNNHHELDIIT